MENIILQKTRYLKALMLTMLVGLFAFGVSAQTITVDAFPAPGSYFLDDEASVTYTTTGDFTGYDIYLHTGASTNITEEEVIAISTDGAGVVINYNWDQVGFNDYRLTAARGSFESETIGLDGISSLAGGTDQGTFYDMDGVGLRRVTTQALDLSGTEQMFLNVFLDASNVQDANPLRVQFSTDGTTWTNMIDTNSDNSWSVSDPAGFLTFELTSGMKTSATQFRVIQEGKSNYLNGEDPWSVNNVNSAGDYGVNIGGLEVLTTEFIANYTIDRPETDISAFNDDDDNPVGSYFAGQSVEIEGTFTGATGQADDFNYVAVFRNGNESFVLGNGSNNVNDISVLGTIPADVEYGLNWDVTIEVFNGTTPTLGLQRNLEPNLEKFGYSGGEFRADDDRYAISEMLNIQSNDNGVVLLGLTKTSTGLAAAGSEIVLEYTTDGETFTQIGDEVSLNADLTDPVEFDISAEAGVESSSTQFRVRQLSNNGFELDTWEITSMDISTGGNILFNNEIVQYNSSSIDVLEPAISLEPVNVPSGLIYPGDEVDLTYNITDGAFPAGTEIMAVLQTASYDYNMGTSTAITPGATEDHTITVTVPPIIGGNYTISLMSTTGAESNDRTMPVYNTTINITEVASDNGVFDGTIDVIYPGDEITASYVLDGSVGAGGELFLEVLDYGSLEADDSDDVWVVLNSETGAGIDGDITGTLPTGINFDDFGNDDPQIRLRIGNGLLANNSLVFAETLSGDPINAFNIDGTESNSNDIFSEVIGNNAAAGPTSGLWDNYISSGERSATTIPFEMPFGGNFSLSFSSTSYNGSPQTVSLLASNDGGSTFESISEEIYEGAGFTLSGTLPQNLWGDEVAFKWVYNEDEASAEFENELDLGNITIQINNAVQANATIFNLSAQFRKPTISLEVLTNTNYIVGEEIEVEYTTEGPFPANTEFALLFTGTLDDGSDFETVVATSASMGSGMFTFNVPIFAYEGDGTDNSLNLYDNLEVIAYDATGGATYVPSEEIILDDDDDFLVIEGTDDSDGDYEFDLAGNRSLLTQAFDLSDADQVYVTFDFDTDNGMMANSLTIPQLQTSIDGGATFQNVEIEENDPVGDGYLYLDGNTYMVELDASAITDATHVRWYQALNGGAGEDVWEVSNISLTLVSGNEITTFYQTNNDPQAITVDHPDVNEYSISQVDPNDAVFNGETVELSFEKDYETTPDYPAGTEFVFSLNGVDDPETGEDVIIGTASALGTVNVTIPLYAGSGNYDINLTAVIQNGDEDYFYAKDDAIGSLDVFNQVLKTTFNGNENEVYYAGNQVTVDYAFENDMTSTTNSEIGDLFYNLILDFDGEEWLLAVDESFTGSFTVDMPPFVNENEGAVDFEVRASVGGPLGVVGETLDNSSIGFLDDTEDWINDDVVLEGFPFGLPGLGGQARLLDVSGRRVFTSTDFDLVEANAARLSFNLYLAADNFPNQIDIDDVLENQQLVFEYSTDGGATYSEIETFLTEGDEDGLVAINLSRNYLLDGDILSNSTRFRFRQEESRFIIGVEDMQIVAANEAEIEYVSADDNGFVPSIKPQAIQITSVGAEEACLSDNITLNYEIRGKFGADNEVSVDYRDDFGNTGTISGEPFNLVEGTGSIEVSLPTVLNAGDNNRNFKFRLTAEDETFDNLGYTTNVSGTYTETNVEVIAPVDLDADFTVDTQQQCDIQDVMLNIDNPQDYFTYQVINALSGEAIGDPLTYDPEEGETEINIGALTENVRLGLQVTAASSTGATTCNTITSTEEVDFFVQPNFALFRGGTSGATLVQPETVVDLCGNSLTLRASYYNNNGTQVNAIAAQVEWFRDNLQTPVGSNASLTTFNKTGEYFARITDGNCVYSTERITVNVSERPDQPTITVDGDLDSCDPENTVTLSGPEGFVNYIWFENGDQLASNSRVITVDNAGSFQLRVSNSDLSNTCQRSNLSNPVIVNIPSNDQFRIQVANVGNTSWSTANILAANQVFDVCDTDERAVRIVEGTSWVGTGTNVKWFKDGVEFSPGIGVSGGTSYPYITESGVYYAEVRGEFGECVFTTPEVTFNVLETPEDAPTITSTGDLTFCAGQGSVVLEGPEGFDYYQWNGVAGSGATSSNNTIEVTQSGTYTLQVGNVSADGAVSCLSPVSNSITVNSRTLPGVPNATVFDNSCGEGPVTFVLTNAGFPNNVASNVSYQLINAATDQPSGLAVTGSGSNSTYLTSDVITEQTTFYIQSTYADGSGCTVSFPETRTFSATPNNVTLEVQGSQLIARYNSGISAVRWYRDEVLLNNAGTTSFGSTSNSITINDASEYSVEVEYATGCVVTASSADIAGKVLGNNDAMAMKVVSYPNPAQADVTLNVNSQYMGKHEVIITSMTGQVMMQSSFEKSSFEAEHAMDVANLEEGIYNVQIRHDGLTQNVRIIKK
jgi:hypothetical protein